MSSWQRTFWWERDPTQPDPEPEEPDTPEEESHAAPESAITDVRNNASHRMIWRFSLGNTWHKLAAPLWVLSAAIPI